MQDGQAIYLNAISRFETDLKDLLKNIPIEYSSKASEVRLIAGERPQIVSNGKVISFSSQYITVDQLNNSLISLCNGSVHSFQKQLSYGYLTLEEGHRIGFAATASYDLNGNINGFRNITAMVLRIARNYHGISKELINKVFYDGLSGLLIAGAPSTGKTTLLKDLTNQLFDMNLCRQNAVIDERGELAKCSNCTVLSGYNKSQAMLMAIRNLSPKLIICDEIGDMNEVKAVEQALNSGVHVIATVHASDKKELLKRPVTNALIKSRAFKRVVIISDTPKPCTIKEVLECDDLLDKIHRNYANSN